MVAFKTRHKEVKLCHFMLGLVEKWIAAEKHVLESMCSDADIWGVTCAGPICSDSSLCPCIFSFFPPRIGKASHLSNEGLMTYFRGEGRQEGEQELTLGHYLKSTMPCLRDSLS